MRRFVQIGILSLVLAGVGGVSAVLALRPDPTLPSPVPLGSPEDHGFDAGVEKSSLWMGPATCASTACHHEGGHDGAPRSEYSTFKSADPHAKAFGVLYAERSDNIMRNFFGADRKHGSATKEPLCLKCHSSFVDDQKKGDRFSHSDGVGCESCHGPAEKWLTAHYQAGFKGMSLEEKASYGMRPTKDLTHRTKLCVTCHVGDANKDVYHDLLGAGHPRLAFEMAGYQGIYPRHWLYADEKARHPDFEARLWTLGQVATARASIELLQSRAERAAQDKRPWPEFAEYDCFKCHQNLQVSSPTQKARWKDPKKAGDLSVALVWSKWNLSQANLYPTFVGAPADGDNSPLGKLREVMKGSPDPAKAAGSAKEAVKYLDDLLIRLRDSKTMTAGQVRGLFDQLVKKGTDQGDNLTWDEATQLYLGIAALHRGLGDLGGAPAVPLPGLEALGNRLRDAFPEHSDSPSLYNPLGKYDDSKEPVKYPEKLSVQFEKIRIQPGK